MGSSPIRRTKKIMKAKEMELALVNFVNYRDNLIVPNVCWGWGLRHECDLLVVTRAGITWEIEIKTSAADLRRDKKKWHGHVSEKIAYLYFAIPDDLLKLSDEIPERAGIIVCTEIEPEDDDPYIHCHVEREPQRNEYAPKIELLDRYKLARLGAIRIWKLKKKILDNDSKKET